MVSPVRLVILDIALWRAVRDQIVITAAPADPLAVAQGVTPEGPHGRWGRPLHIRSGADRGCLRSQRPRQVSGAECYRPAASGACTLASSRTDAGLPPAPPRSVGCGVPGSLAAWHPRPSCRPCAVTTRGPGSTWARCDMGDWRWRPPTARQAHGSARDPARCPQISDCLARSQAFERLRHSSGPGLGALGLADPLRVFALGGGGHLHRGPVCCDASPAATAAPTTGASAAPSRCATRGRPQRAPGCR